MKDKKLEDFSIIRNGHEQQALRDENIFLAGGFGIVYNMENLIKELLSGRVATFQGQFYFRINQPYRLKEARILLALQGGATVLYNLMEYTLTPSTILLVPEGSIIQIKEMRPGTKFRMLGFGSNFVSFSRKEEQLEYYQQSYKSPLLPLTPDDLEETEKYFSLIWATVQHWEFRKEVVQSLLMALLQHISYIRKNYHSVEEKKHSHQEDVFRRFILLVNKYSAKERTVGFYAGKLCLTPRYLNTIVKLVSGKTVMEWINQAVVLEAKVLLKHSNLLIYQVADKLNFANPSFFCKFFRREAGMTPQEYQGK